VGGIVVSHPGIQHSHQLALALYERNLLSMYYSGVPVLSPDDQQPFWLSKIAARKLKVVPIPRGQRCHPIGFQLMLRAGGRLPILMDRDDFTHRMFHLYDWWFSRRLASLKPDVVVAYENSAYHTFKVAKAMGARCVLDAASLHHTAGSRWQVDSATPFRAEINRRKDMEIEQADLILTCSPLAAKSYEEADVASTKLRPLLLGAELPSMRSLWVPHEHSLHYVFAGALSYRKSIDLILSVFRRLHAEGVSVRVSFVGGLAETKWLGEIHRTPNAEYLPNMEQTQLFEYFSKADCLLLPSRFDSFGMVVAEAMACGAPAIVSTQVGAKAMIEQFPGSGWIVEPSAESLYRCLQDHANNRSQVFGAREHAKEAASSFTWDAYRTRAGNLFESFCK
jgi:glycosyltransferase involved in cell wall biosynthesis